MRETETQRKHVICLGSRSKWGQSPAGGWEIESDSGRAASAPQPLPPLAFDSRQKLKKIRTKGSIMSKEVMEGKPRGTAGEVSPTLRQLTDGM